LKRKADQLGGVRRAELRLYLSTVVRRRLVTDAEGVGDLQDETGGESYMIGFGSPVSFQPFLDQIRTQMQNQYLLTFDARPEQKSGLQPVRISITEKDASIAAPDKVYVKSGT
jgi:hypothetical protein